MNNSQSTIKSLTTGQIIKNFENRQFIFSVLGLMILLGLSIIANNFHLQAVAQQSTKYISRMIQLDDFREVGLILEEALTETFKSIRYKSERPGRSFAMPASVNLDDKSFWHFFTTERVTVSVVNPLTSGKSDEITFEFARFGLFPYALGIWILLILVSIPQTRLVKRRLIEQFEKDLNIETNKVHEAISEEVRHNLRTPLASLMRLPARMPDNMNQDRELLTTSINQIRKITAALDRKTLSQSLDPQNSEQIYDTLIRAISQITASLPANISLNSQVDDSLISAKLSHIPVEMQLVLGNIINNSIDAIQEGNGAISIRAVDLAPDLMIEIEDNGPGIEKDNLSRIFEKGFTLGKSNGTGLGLYHAMTWITKWGGRIHASSIPNFKTVIQISIPIKDRSSWYVPRLKFSEQAQIYILDDQLSARQLWQFKLGEQGVKNEHIRFFRTVSEIKKALQDSPIDLANTFFLFDYDLKDEETGLDLLKTMPSSAHRYLVTGHFDKLEIRNACEIEGLFLIPKSEISDLPIIISHIQK